MGELTEISWATSTFNPWIGCEKISQGCRACYASVDTYARVSASRGLPLWGPGSTRHRTGADTWKKPLKWNRESARLCWLAESRGLVFERPRVFCASLCDVFEEHPSLDGYRADLWPIIENCTDLDWMLLTKRPENIMRMVPVSWASTWPAHVWAGCTVENRKEGLPRVEALRDVPAPIRFLSIEPLLEDVGEFDLRGISLAIVGGESGPGARPFDLAWARSIRDQCKSAGVAYFCKQLGAHVIWDGCSSPGEHWPTGTKHEDTGLGHWRARLNDKKGGAMEEWPPDLRVREMPKGA